MTNTSEDPDILAWLWNTLKMGSTPGLERIIPLLNAMGNPQLSYPSIHVTGTNGKGSTTVLIASILSQQGYHVGMFSSPHLINFQENIAIDGQIISTASLIDLARRIKPVIEELVKNKTIKYPSFYEIFTAIAYQYYADAQVDVAVIEAWMGGIHDATNTIQAKVAVITNVGLEHTKYLGNTIEAIARNKAGVIKPGSILVTAVKKPEVLSILSKTCKAHKVPLWHLDNEIQYKMISHNHSGQVIHYQGKIWDFPSLYLPFIGRHQARNCATAIGAIEAASQKGIAINPSTIQLGLQQASWPGRGEIMQAKPWVVLDCAKEKYAVKVSKELIQDYFTPSKIITITSISSDKDTKSMLKILSSISNRLILTRHSRMKRASNPANLVEQLPPDHPPYEIIPDPLDALSQSLKEAKPEDLIWIAGSVFLIGDIRQYWYPHITKYYPVQKHDTFGQEKTIQNEPQ